MDLHELLFIKALVSGGGSGGGRGWTLAQINLFDTLLSHVKYTDADGGEYADELIASLKANPAPGDYEDADEVEC